MATETKTTAASGDNSKMDIDYQELMSFLNDLDDKKTSINEATGKLRSAIKAIIDQKGYHKGALGTIRMIEAMSETGRNDYLRTFEPMFDVMMQEKWATEREDLLDADPKNLPA